MTSECEQIYGDANTVTVDIQILFTHPRDPHKRIGISHHAVDHVIDDYLDIFELQITAPADVFGHAVQHFVGSLERAGSRCNLNVDGRRILVDRQLY